MKIQTASLPKSHNWYKIMQMHKLLSSLVIFTFVLLFSFSANARDIYNVTDIAVFFEADNSNTAREIALKDGEKKAYEELAKRFVDYGYTDKAPDLSAAKINELIVQMKIQEEKISGTSYSAKLDFWFNPRKTSGYFNVKNYRGTPVGAKHLILPVLIEGGREKIWDHKWLGAWTNFRSEKILVPIGDLEDMQALKAEDMSVGDYQGIDKLARRYRAPIIILAKAEYTNLENTLIVSVEALEGKDGKIYHYEYPGEVGIGASELFDSAANDILYRIQKNKLAEKQKPLDEEEQESVERVEYYRNYDDARKYKYNRFEAVVETRNLAEWSRIRKKLLRSDYVEKMEVISFTPGKALVEIVHDGTVSQFAAALDLEYLQLQNPESRGWVITEIMQREVAEEEEEDDGVAKDGQLKSQRKRERAVDDKKYIKKEE